MLLHERFRAIHWDLAEARRTPPRHAALRDDPAAQALRLFRDHGALTDAELHEVFGNAEVPAGLIAGNQAAFRIDPVGPLYLASDWPSEPDDAVLAAGETAAILHRAAARFAPGARTLDLCCGSGTLALLLGAALGTDLNPRAIQLARMNACINGIEGVELREGSLFEPVRGERFDLIVCQPPFVPQPAGVAKHLFLHGGSRGDELAQLVIRQCADHLRPNGSALIYSDWPLAENESLAGRMAHPGLAAHLFASPMVTVDSYCAAYGEHLTPHLRGLGITGIRQCLTILRAGTGVQETEVLPHQWPDVGRLIEDHFRS